MAIPGFCIFKVTLQDGRKSGEVEFSTQARLDPGTTAFHDLIEGLESWRDDIFFGRFSIPKTLDDFDATKILRPDSPGERAIRFLEVNRNGRSRLDLKFEYGTPGSHEIAMAETAAGNVPLGDKAPGNVYLASLILAKDHSAGYLIGQSRGRTIPATNALRMGSIGMRKRLLSERPDEASRYWDVVANRVPYGNRLAELIEHGRVREIELVKYESASSGKRKPKRIVTINQRGFKQSKLREANELMLSWLRSGADELTDQSQRKKEIESADGMIDVAFTPEDYDEVGFIVQNDAGKRATIAPSSIADTYLFPTEGNEPISSFEDMISQAQPHVEGLAAEERLDIDW